METTSQGTAPGNTSAGAPGSSAADDAAAKAAADKAAADKAVADKAAADEAARAAAAAGASKVPEKYELKLPDDSGLDATIAERTAATARTLGLSNEVAQGVLDFVADEIADREAATLEAHQPGGDAWKKQVEGFEAAALKDAEIGGSPDKLKESALLGQRVLATYFPESIEKFLHETGFGSHPDVIRGLAKIGRAVAEDTLVMPRSAAAAGSKELGDVFYPTTSEKKE